MGLFGGGNSRTTQQTYTDMTDQRVAAADNGVVYSSLGGALSLSNETELSNVGNTTTNYLDGGAIEGSFGFADSAFGSAADVVGAANTNVSQVALQTQQSALGFGSQALDFGADAFNLTGQVAGQAITASTNATNSALGFGERAFETVTAAGGQVVNASNSALQFGERAFETVTAAGGQVVNASNSALQFGERAFETANSSGERQLAATNSALSFGEKSFEFGAASTGQAIDAVKANANAALSFGEKAFETVIASGKQVVDSSKAALSFGEKSYEFGSDVLGKSLSTTDKAISSSAGLVNKSFELVDSQGRAALDFAKTAQASAAEGLATNTATLAKALDTARASNDEKLIQTIVPWIVGAGAVVAVAMAWRSR